MHENRETSEIPAAQPGRRSAGEGQSHKARLYVSEDPVRATTEKTVGEVAEQAAVGGHPVGRKATVANYFRCNSLRNFLKAIFQHLKIRMAVRKDETPGRSPVRATTCNPSSRACFRSLASMCWRFCTSFWAQMVSS
jgi:hypothetical protein